jgi:hypothetical protein
MKMSLAFENLHGDGPLESKWDRLLKIVGDFEIQIDERCLFFGSEFPLVEFWLQLTRWLGQLEEDDPPSDFEYVSMESEQEPLIWFRRSAGGWTIGGVNPEYDEPHQFQLEELVDPSRQFLRDLEGAVRKRFRVELPELERQF